MLKRACASCVLVRQSTLDEYVNEVCSCILVCSVALQCPSKVTNGLIELVSICMSISNIINTIVLRHGLEYSTRTRIYKLL